MCINMEQIVKIFVHQSYFIENDLIVDYNVEQGARENVSPKDWIALIPKGWSGVDEQVAFKTVNTDNDVINLAIKSVVMERSCFQNVVECEKQYQLMYIGQYLEILGRSEYFIFLHQSGKCNCISPTTTKTESKESSKQNRLSVNSSFFTRKSPHRQSPTPREFYKNRPQLQNTLKYEKSTASQWTTNNCIKCNAPSNYTALESAYLTKIQDLTIHIEVMEQQLLKAENDLIQTLEVVNKQFKLSKTISQQKNNIQKFIDEVVDGLLNDGKISFWAHDQEFSVVRVFPANNQTSLTSDECTPLSFNKLSINSSKEVYLKAIIGQQEQTIQHLVNKIKDSFDLFVKINAQPTEQNTPIVTSSESKTSNIGYMDNFGTTYFSSPPYITDTANDLNMYLSNNISEKMKPNKNIYKSEHNTTSGSESSYIIESKINEKIKDKVLTFEDGKKNTNKYITYTPPSENYTDKKPNKVNSIKIDKHCNAEHSDDSI